MRWGSKEQEFRAEGAQQAKESRDLSLQSIFTVQRWIAACLVRKVLEAAGVRGGVL